MQQNTEKQLSTLYEQYGYKRYIMSKFEEYDLYAKNKSFINNENIITFTDLHGRLLALKPDVTLSIVKNTAGDNESLVKVYYNESVFRSSKATHDIKETTQTGLELIGDIDLYSQAEVLSLACQSLKAASEDYLIDISHIGFVSGLVDQAVEDEVLKREIVNFISRKNSHQLKKLCEDHGVDADITEKLIKLVSIYGGFKDAIKSARELVINDAMSSSLDELERIYNAASVLCDCSKVNLDFSIVNDMRYYNSVIFQGYIKGVPDYVLSGGRYDRIVQKMGRDACAIGFGINIDMLPNHSNNRQYDVDCLIVCGSNTDECKIASTVKDAHMSGKTVRVTNDENTKLKYKEFIKL